MDSSKISRRGFIQIALSDKTIGEEINIASNSEISIKDTLELISKLMNSDVKFITDEKRIRPGKSEVFRLWGSNTKINQLTGYTPSTPLEEGLKETINWFSNKVNLAKYKSNIYNV